MDLPKKYFHYIGKYRESKLRYKQKHQMHVLMNKESVHWLKTTYKVLKTSEHNGRVFKYSHADVYIHNKGERMEC